MHLLRPRLRIRVAGTNGKGSTSFMLADALKACGLKVGLYTSPHILNFNERIRINGAPITSTELDKSLSHLMPYALKHGASYFETATVLALDQFSKAGVDVEILEAGVGAKLDATTAVKADMALITPIGLDHQAWLGESLKEIAEEKAFAMQGCSVSITAPQQPEAMNKLLAFNQEVVEAPMEQWPKLQMYGLHQGSNASLAWAAVRALKERGLIHGDLEKARAAIEACQLPGRLQNVQMDGANIWLDAAHNRHAVEALLPSLKALANPFDAILVFTREDRSLDDCLSLLEPYTKKVVAHSSGTPVAALQAELALNPQGLFLVLGSFMTVAEVLRYKNQGQPNSADAI